MRHLVGLVLVITAGCADSGGGDDDGYETVCNPGEGPVDTISSFNEFYVQNLTCARIEIRLYCSGTCCKPAFGWSSETPIACSGRCVTLDEATCASDASCYVARSSDAFYSGATDSFVGCFFQSKDSSTTAPCAERGVKTCAYDGLCAGLYDSSSKFVECVDEALIAGSCNEVATCTIPPPACPADRTPGVAEACYTGACIPNALCSP